MLTAFDDMPRKDRLIIALDCDADKALYIAYALRGEASWVKIGMTLYYAYGSDLIRMLKESGYKVFLDLKFHDIPHQVRGAARSAASTGADMLTMHAIGGAQMMSAAVEGTIEGAEGIDAVAPTTLAITVLTSMDEESLHRVGIERSVDDQVLSMASLAKESGVSGVVASPREAWSLRSLLGPEAFIVTPGVRPRDAELGDQSRVTTPKEAFDNGASHIVIGRPITDAPDPIEAFRAIAADL